MVVDGGGLVGRRICSDLSKQEDRECMDLEITKSRGVWEEL